MKEIFDLKQEFRAQIAQLEAENAALQERLDNYTASSIHSCHDECRRPMCVLRRDNAALKQQLEDSRTLFKCEFVAREEAENKLEAAKALVSEWNERQNDTEQELIKAKEEVADARRKWIGRDFGHLSLADAIEAVTEVRTQKAVAAAVQPLREALECAERNLFTALTVLGQERGKTRSESEEDAGAQLSVIQIRQALAQTSPAAKEGP